MDRTTSVRISRELQHVSEFARDTLADLDSVGDRVPGASGQVIFNDVKGAEKVVVQANVWDMEPETTYELHVTVHSVEPIFNFGTFTTDEDGDGSLHASVP